MTLCFHCHSGEHDKCNGAVNLIQWCECRCQDKKAICQDCGDLISSYRPDCHTMPSGEDGDKDKKVVDTQVTSGGGKGGSSFPFTLDDLSFWVVKRKDGTTIKYAMMDQKSSTSSSNTGSGSHASFVRPITGFSVWCNHNPTGKPIWDEDGIKIWIADAIGCRNHGLGFQTIMDCGNILNLARLTEDLDIESNDLDVRDELLPYTHIGRPTPPRVLKFAWADRKAPPLKVEFWEKFVEIIRGEGGGSILTACQGGHGRSGTSLVCLMMVLNPEYTPYDAICHLRAMHCPRAIESKEQHTYINDVGIHLGRAGNVGDVEQVKDFKQAFLNIKLKSAKKYQDQLKGVK